MGDTVRITGLGNNGKPVTIVAVRDTLYPAVSSPGSTLVYYNVPGREQRHCEFFASPAKYVFVEDGENLVTMEEFDTPYIRLKRDRYRTESLLGSITDD